jgi:hypothetical protein
MALTLAAAAAPSAWAGNPNGIVFRAVGIFQGEVEEGRCKVPVASQAIADHSRSICRDATEVVDGTGSVTVTPTQMYPEFGPEFLNFCGGFLALENNMFFQAINLRRVKIRYRIPGQGFPVLCRNFRSFTVFAGGRINPVNSTSPSPFGAPNMTFTQMIPIYSAQTLDCLRDPTRGNIGFDSVTGEISQSVTVVAKLRAYGRRDDGKDIKSNRVRYSLTLLPEGAVPPAPNAGRPPQGNPVRCSDPVP